MTPEFKWLCLGCGGVVHQEYLFTHANFHIGTNTAAEFRAVEASSE